MTGVVRWCRTDSERIGLIKSVYSAVFVGCESFEEDNVGADLAYILGAVARDGFCEWPEDRPIVQILREAVGDDHPIWKYIEVTKGGL